MLDQSVPQFRRKPPILHILPAHKPPRRIDNSQLHQHRQRIDQPAAANRMRPSAPNHVNINIIAVDHHPLNRTRHRPAAMQYPRPLQRRPRRTTGRIKPVLMAQDQFAVGADIHQQRRLMLRIQVRRHRRRQRIRPHEPGDILRRKEHPRRMNRQPGLRRRHRTRLHPMRQIGTLPQLADRPFQQQVIHRRIAHRRTFIHVS